MLIKIKFQIFSNVNVSTFITNMNSEFDRYNPPITNANHHAEYLNGFLNEMLNIYFPIKTRELHEKRLASPWINNQIKKYIDKKHNWFRLARGGTISWNSYKRYSSAVRDLLRMAETDYYRYRLGSLCNNQDNWKIINDLMGNKSPTISDCFIIDGEEISDPLVIANRFNNYFVEYPKSLHNSLGPSNRNYSNNIPVFCREMDFGYFTVEEIRNKIVKSKNGGNLGDIHMKFLKICVDLVAASLCG